MLRNKSRNKKTIQILKHLYCLVIEDIENYDIIEYAPREFEQGLMKFITTTGLTLASLAMVNITYNKWLKFINPLIIIIAVLAIELLEIGAII